MGLKTSICCWNQVLIITDMEGQVAELVLISYNCMNFTILSSVNENFEMGTECTC